jgi:hypothetical protein
VTPPAWGETVARHLSSSKQVVIQHLAHLPDGLTNVECLDQIMLDFYSRSSAENLSIECTDTMLPPPFLTSGQGDVTGTSVMTGGIDQP